MYTYTCKCNFILIHFNYDKYSILDVLSQTC